MGAKKAVGGAARPNTRLILTVCGGNALGELRHLVRPPIDRRKGRVVEKRNVIYRNLDEVIVLTGLTYDENYINQEKELLTPRLEAVGYTNIQWQDGERDSFGPLTRVCSCNDRYGNRVYFIYG